MSDATVVPGFNPQPPITSAFNSIMNVTVLPGQAITPLTGGNAGKSGLALSSAAQTARCSGLAAVGTASGLAGVVKYADLLQLPIAQWDAALADTSTTGLTPGAYYYVSDVTAGKLTATAPVTGGHFVAPVGLALNATTMLILLSVPIVVGS